MVNEQKQLSILAVASVIFGVVVATVLTISGPKYRAGQTSTNFLQAVLAGTRANSWAQAAEKVKEDRGEPAGKQAKVEIPPELRHYRDTRRFLATQVAEVREQTLKTPRDLVDLANMVERGEMVALQPVTEDYILFGVGGHADKDPFTRYEGSESTSIYDEAGLQREYARIGASQAARHDEIAGFRKQLNSLTKRERSKRASLQAQIANTQKALKAEEKNKQLLDKHYGNADRRARFFNDYASLQSLAKSFRGRNYDISEPSDRHAMKVALLSSLRPEALEVLEGIASAYREKFDRPLPITSLVRPDEYQHKLSKVNPNATRIETPPHSTGLAFDIMYRYMTAEEQSFLMAELARLEDDGRIEVLRENRDHYHVFAFIDGARPNEGLIAAVMGAARSPKPRAATVSHHAKKKSAKAKAKPQRAKRLAAKTTRNRRR
jgi:hypothetical protein